jgi:serine protease Do
MKKKPMTGALVWLLAVTGLMLSTTAVLARDLPVFTELVEKYAPAVVNISTKTAAKSERHFGGGHPFNIPKLPEDGPLNDLLRRFFGDDLGGLNEAPELFDTESLGSGFVISPDGYILTNHHVVKGADEILVRLSDRREYVATLIGSDKATDIALIKIDANDLPTVSLGSASELKVGEWVLAIGSPFGFDHSVTAGIVSAKGRNLPTENYVPFIQTDVAINPGNSGGPLFNLDGQVVGVNSQIYSRTGGFMGLSFAIPIEVAMNVADQLRTKGKVSRGWLGVLIQDVTRDLAESFGMDQPMGALVAKVIDDSPAKRAGIQVGDVILGFNGKAVQKSSQLPPMVGAANIDHPAQVEVLRDGNRQTVEVNIGELPEEAMKAAVAPQEAEEGPTGQEQRFGLTVSDLTPAQRTELAVDKGGVYVEEVRPGVAAVAGIQPGDVILMLNNRPVDTAEGFLAQLGELTANKSVAVLVHRDDGARFLALRAPPEE